MSTSRSASSGLATAKKKKSQHTIDGTSATDLHCNCVVVVLDIGILDRDVSARGVDAVSVERKDGEILLDGLHYDAYVLK